MALIKDYTNCEDDDIIDKDTDCKASISDFTNIKASDSDDITSMKSSANTLSMSQYIDRVYAARKVYIKDTKAESKDKIIENRYNDEPALLKRKLNY